MEIEPLASSSGGNAFLVTDGDEQIMIELGLRWRRLQIKTGFATSGLRAALVSHEHKDHCKAAEAAMRAGVDVYMSGGTAEALDLGGHHRLHILVPEEITQIGPWRVRPVRVEHDAAEPLGFFIEAPSKARILYVTDAPYIPGRFKRVTHLMVEANHDRASLQRAVEEGRTDAFRKSRITSDHMGLERLLIGLRKMDLSHLQEIWLLHMSSENANQERIERAVRRVTGLPVSTAKE